MRSARGIWEEEGEREREKVGELSFTRKPEVPHYLLDKSENLLPPVANDT